MLAVSRAKERFSGFSAALASNGRALCLQDVILVAPRNRLPGTEEVAPQWELPFHMNRSEEARGNVHGEVQSGR